MQARRKKVEGNCGTGVERESGGEDYKWNKNMI